MTPEERAEEIMRDDFAGVHYGRDGLRSHITKAIRAALAEEREACCNAVCKYCADRRPVFQFAFSGNPLGYYWVHEWDDGPYKVRGRPCKATSIRGRKP